MRRTSALLALFVLTTACHRQRPAPRPPAATSAPAAATTTPAAATSPAPAPRVLVAGRRVVPVLMYHDVVSQPTVWFDLTTTTFAEQMAQLRRARVNPVSADDLLAHLANGRPLPPRAVVLTFDQGTKGLYTNAWPILKRYGYRATFFVHTGFVGRPSPTKQHVTWAELREMAATGLVDVQPMTVSFPENLNTVPPAQLRQELAASQAAVTREMGRPARYFAYPYGRGGERVARLLAELGYQAAFNEVRAPCAAPADRYFLPRFNPKRLDEVLALLGRQPPTDAPLFGGLIDLPLTPAPAPPVAGLDLVRGAWPARAGAGGVQVGTLSLPDVLPLMVLGRFHAPADGAELRLQGRPLVVGNQRQVVFCAYRRWMTAGGRQRSGCDSLDQLVQRPGFAFLGADWLMHQGRPVPGPARSGRAVIVGLDPEGRLAWGRTQNPLSRQELQRRLSKWREAVRLDG